MQRRDAMLGFLIALALGGCGGSLGGAKSGTSGEAAKLVGAPAPDFSLEPVGGGAPVTPSAFKGHVLIVDFWATWCAPCRQSFPAYQRLVEEFGGKLVVVGVSVNDDASGIADFRSQTGVKFPLVWDEGQHVAGAYEPGTMPTSYVVDKSGIVTAVHEGFHAGDEEALRNDVKALL